MSAQMRLGLLGFPLGHSYSARLFSCLRERLGLELDYRNFEREGGLGDFLHWVRENLDGFNVTTPYKESVLPWLDELSPEAAAIRAVNVVRVQGGKLYGHNTDWRGFISPLEKVRLKGPALVFGAGGAARACLFGLWRLGVRGVFLTSRTLSRAQRLAEEFQDKLDISVFSPDQVKGAVSLSQLVVNATPLGMWPRVADSPPVPELDLSGKVFYDLVYNPLETTFLRKAKSQGAQLINGLEMFLVQTAENLKLWLGKDFRKEVEACSALLLRESPTERGSSG